MSNIGKRKSELITSIRSIIKLSKNTGSIEKAIAKSKKDIKFVSETLDMSNEEAMFWALFVNNCDDSSIRYKDLGSDLSIDTLDILCYNDIVESLLEKGYIKRATRRGYGDRDISHFQISKSALLATLKGEKYVKPAMDNLSIGGFLSEIDKIYKDSEDIYEESVFQQVMELVFLNPNLPMSKFILEEINIKDNTSIDYEMESITNFPVIIFLLSCILERYKNEDFLSNSDLEDYSGNRAVNVDIMERLNIGSHMLLKRDLLVGYIPNELNREGRYCLSNKARIAFGMKPKEAEAEIKAATRKHYKEISKKELFYNKSDEQQISQLQDLLKEKNFNKVQKRMAKARMRKGFACLFYGAPGTGKTETVMQLAKSTGRDLFIVNVNDVKSKWVGDSEKLIKGVFDDYREACKNLKKAPVLLFNEADAILGVRMEGAQRAVDKMENSIQNIILQEMETLDGIMIATTNLTANLDSAFERRFIYKVEFHKPDLEVKCKIWKSMIKNISEDDAITLAKDYNFSGGQIENISRKATIDLILTGEEINLQKLQAYCNQEKIGNRPESKRIGFV